MRDETSKHNSLTQPNPTWVGLDWVEFSTCDWLEVSHPRLIKLDFEKKLSNLIHTHPLHIIIIQACKPFLSSSPGCTNVQQHFFLNIIFFNGPFTAFSFLFHILIKVVNNVSVI